MITIYHNPRCKKSRAGLEYLKSKTEDFKIRQYLKEPLSEKEIKDLLMKMNEKAENIVRKQEDYYKKQLKGKEFNEEEWISILAENPKLIQRPIVEKKYKALLAQPPENIDKLF